MFWNICLRYDFRQIFVLNYRKHISCRKVAQSTFQYKDSLFLPYARGSNQAKYYQCFAASFALSFCWFCISYCISLLVLRKGICDHLSTNLSLEGMDPILNGQAHDFHSFVYIWSPIHTNWLMEFHTRVTKNP